MSRGVLPFYCGKNKKKKMGKKTGVKGPRVPFSPIGGGERELRKVKNFKKRWSVALFLTG